MIKNSTVNQWPAPRAQWQIRQLADFNQLIVRMLDFFVYAIHNSERDKIYVGHTENLERRLARHNKILPNKGNSYTSRNSGIWELVYSEKVEDRKQAIKREKQLKSAQGRASIRRIIANNIENKKFTPS